MVQTSKLDSGIKGLAVNKTKKWIELELEIH